MIERDEDPYYGILVNANWQRLGVGLQLTTGETVLMALETRNALVDRSTITEMIIMARFYTPYLENGQYYLGMHQERRYNCKWQRGIFP